MKIIIKYTNLDSTPALAKFINEKISSLSKFIQRWEKNGDVVADVEIARTTKHHNKGDVFHAEINLGLPGKLLRAEHEDKDARIAIDKVKDKMKREVTRLKDLKDSK